MENHPFLKRSLLLSSLSVFDFRTTSCPVQRWQPKFFQNLWHNQISDYFTCWSAVDWIKTCENSESKINIMMDNFLVPNKEYCQYIWNVPEETQQYLGHLTSLYHEKRMQNVLLDKPTSAYTTQKRLCYTCKDHDKKIHVNLTNKTKSKWKIANANV